MPKMHNEKEIKMPKNAVLPSPRKLTLFEENKKNKVKKI